MISTKYFFLTLLLSAIFPFCSFSQTSVGVMSFKNNGQADYSYLSDGIADMLSTTLANSNEVRLVERGQLNRVTDELKLGLSGLVDEKTAAEVGKLTGATYMVLGSFINLGKSLRMDVKVVETQTAMVIPGATASVKASSIESLDEAIDELAAKLITNLTGERIQAQKSGDPNRESILEFTYDPRLMLVTLVDGKMLEAREGELMAQVTLNHGNHLISIEKMKGLFKSEKLLDTTIFLPGGTITRTRIKDNKLEVFAVDKIATPAYTETKTHQMSAGDFETVTTGTASELGQMMTESMEILKKTTEAVMPSTTSKQQPLNQTVAKRKSLLVIMSKTGLCEIYIDGEEKANIGVTPIDGLGKAEIELDAGNYLLMIDGFGVWFENTIEIGNGEIIKMLAEPEEVKILGRNPR